MIVFANQKGGVAKTTTTLNLACAFAEKGHRVLCVDMDPQGNLTMSQGIDPDTLELSMFDVLVHDTVHTRRVVDLHALSVLRKGASHEGSTRACAPAVGGNTRLSPGVRRHSRG